MTRRCSHCSNNGHNSRTCPSRGGLKLFGVRLTDGLIKKSASMGNLSSPHLIASSSWPNPGSPSSDPLRDSTPNAEGYVSDDPADASCSSSCRAERKKGIPWTEEEHRLFLVGLHKLGKGDWRGIARNFVVSRTPTQVASHAQKYFIRQSNSTRRKRRTSLFDMVTDMNSLSPYALQATEERFVVPFEKESPSHLPPLELSLGPESNLKASVSNGAPGEPKEEETVACSTLLTPVISAFYPAYIPRPFPVWGAPHFPSSGDGRRERHQILKPTAIHSKDPVNVDELVGMSNKLSLREGLCSRLEPSELSLKLLGAPSRQSAFHASPAAGGSDLRQGSPSNPIHAV